MVYLDFNPDHMHTLNHFRYTFKNTIIGGHKSSSMDKIYSPKLSTNGSWVHVFLIQVLLWLGSNVQMLSKAEVGDHAQGGKTKGLH